MANSKGIEMFLRSAACAKFAIYAVLAICVVVYAILELGNSVSTGVAAELSELEEYRSTPFARFPHKGPVQWRSAASSSNTGFTSAGKVDFEEFRVWAAAENLSTYGERLNSPDFRPDIDGKRSAIGEAGDSVWEAIYFPNNRHFTLYVNESTGTFRIFSRSPR
jgi:hypothetical protein